MRIVIAGAGEVGFHLARLLAEESHDIVLIDNENDRLQYAENHIDVFTVHGDSTSFKVLKKAKISKTDLLIAVTSEQSTNLTTTIIGKKLGAQKTVARISNTEYLNDKETLDLTSLGIDELISPESLAAAETKRLLKASAATDTFEFEGGKLSLKGINLNKHAPLVGMSMIDLTKEKKDLNLICVAIQRQNKTIIPRGNTRFELNDNAYFITDSAGFDHILELSGKEQIGIKDIMILGASRTGINTIKELAKSYRIKLIERDKDRCLEISDQLPDALIINGDGTNVELLEEEGIEEVDAFVALTGNSETNILSCLVAKNHGVAKTIAMIENMEYINLSQNIGIDTMINKKLIAANSIFRYIRKGDVISITSLHGVSAEILEFEVKDKCKVIKKPIKDLDFPESAIIGGVVRDGKAYIASGNFQIEPDDRVVVFSLSESIHKVERFFK